MLVKNHTIHQMLVDNGNRESLVHRRDVDGDMVIVSEFDSAEGVREFIKFAMGDKREVHLDVLQEPHSILPHSSPKIG